MQTILPAWPSRGARLAASAAVLALALTALAVATGCGDSDGGADSDGEDGDSEAVERFPIEVDADGVPTFSWEGGPVQGIELQECYSGCDASCSDPIVAFEAAYGLWSVGTDDLAEGEVGFASPAQMGVPQGAFIPGDLVFESGKTYLVLAFRRPTAGADATEEGCAIYTMP